MASIIKKVKNGKVYYYAAESGRVNGKPRITWQKYLGTIETIIKRQDSTHSLEVHQTDVFEAGGVAAMLNIANRIGVTKIIDEIVPKKDQGPSVGEYMLMALLNRILDPCSKLKMSDWYKETVLLRLWKYPAKRFSSQHFWNNMDLINEKHIEEIQEKITKRVIEVFKINPESLLYDTTNFFTYIATGNTRNTIAQRGKSKAKRNDLRQVGLALLVSKDFSVPLFHKVYQGNQPDRGIFTERAKEIKRFQKKSIGFQNDSTIVFDKGNISEDGFEELVGSGQNFICAIPRNTVPEMFSTSIEHFKNVQGIAGTKAVSGDLEYCGKTFKYVLAYSESYFAARLKDLTDKIQKCEKKLRELDKKLAKWADRRNYKNRPSYKSVEKLVKSILTGDYMQTVIKVENFESDGIQRITYNVDQQALDMLMKHELGRTLIISTRLEWSEEEIINAYRGMYAIESAFRNMKNQEFLHWQPAFHWTDSKIKVHGLYCVLALLISTLAYKEVKEAGIDISLPKMLEELSRIREVALIFQEDTTARKKSRLSISNMSSRQKKIAEVLQIAEVLGG